MNVKIIKKYIFLLLFFSSFLTSAQNCNSKQNNVWYFGYKAGLDFTNLQGGLPTPLSNGQTYIANDGTGEIWDGTGSSSGYHNEGVASISKPDGSLLFYTNGVKIWDSNQNEILSGLSGSQSSAQSAIIIKDPVNCLQYYVFTIDATAEVSTQLPYNGFHYTLLKFNSNYTFNSVITFDQEIIDSPYLAESLTSIKGTNNNYYIITHDRDGFNYHITELNSLGVQTPVTYISTSPNIFAEDYERKYIRANKSGTLVAIPSDKRKIDLYSFDKTSGTMSFLNDIEIPEIDPAPGVNSVWHAYGLEFSPSDNFLYLSDRYTDKIFQINISNISSLSYQIKNIGSGYSTAALQIGPDDRLYISESNANFIKYYATPDVGFNSSTTFNSITFTSPAICSEGLPNFVPENMFEISLSANTICYGSSNGSITLDNNDNCGMYNYQWSGPNGYSATTKNINGLIAGTYTVTATSQLFPSCYVVESAEVLGHSQIQANVTPLHPCTNTSNGKITISNVSGGTTPYTYSWSSGQTTQNIVNQSAGNYTLTITDALGCTSTFSQILEEINYVTATSTATPTCACTSIINTSFSSNPYNNVNAVFYSWNNTSYGDWVFANSGYFTSADNMCEGNNTLNYKYQITGSNTFCYSSEEVTVPHKEIDLDITADVVNSTCSNIYDGEINNITVIGGNGTPPYTYSHNNVNWQSGNSYAGWAYGNHPVYVMDSDGCVDSESFFVYSGNDPCECFWSLPLFSSVSPYTINSPTVLGNGSTEVVYVVEENITLNSTLTLNKVKLLFKPGKHMYIASGKTFNINNNSTLTSVCDEMWQGIIVVGANSFADPYPTINMNDNSTISNAVIGIEFSNATKIIANDSYFVNNYIDLKRQNKDPLSTSFQNYYSKFIITNCEFKTTSALLGPTYFYPNNHVDVVASANMVFDNCTFKNETPFVIDSYGSTITNNRGKGIYAYQADLSIQNNCSFEKLLYGVYLTSDNYFGGDSKIINSNFVDNFRAMYFYNKKNTHFIVKDNDINVWDRYVYTSSGNGQTNTYAWGYGAYLNNCDAYDFRANKFYAGNNGEESVVGMYVNNSGSDDNLVYNNTFDGFSSSNGVGKSTALIVLGNNGETQVGGTGLQIKCNDFGVLNNPSLKNSYDIATLNSTATIKEKQGAYSSIDVTAPANNRFFNHYDGSCTNGNNSFFSSASQVFNYYVYKDDYNQFFTDFDNCRTTNKVTRLVSGNLPTFIKEDACPEDPNTGGGGGITPIEFGVRNSNSSFFTDLQSYLTDYNNQISTIESELQTEVDNGNTVALQTNVENVSATNYDNINQKLEETNGYVSDEVVLEYIKTDLNRPISKAITLKNISPLPEKAKAEIDNTELSDGLKTYLHNYQNGINVREQKQNEIGKLRSNQQWLINYAINEVRSLENNKMQIAELINVLNSYQDLFSQTKVYNLHTQNGNIADALLKLNEISNLTSRMNRDEAENITNWVDVQKIVLQLRTLEINNDTLYKTKYDSIVNANRNLLYSVVYDNTQKSQADAQILLQQAGIDSFEEITDLPSDEILENKSAKTYSSNTVNNENLFYIYPNPVNDILTVEYAILTEANVNSISIYNAKGVLLIKTPISETIGIVKINVSQLAKGNYFVTFGSEGINSYSKKFIVN